MTTGQLVIICATFLIALIIVASVVVGVMLRRGDSDLDSDLAPAGSEVVVHTRRPDDQSIRGRVASSHPDRIVLRDATYLNGTGGQAAKGLINIPTSAVSSWQAIEDGDA